MMNTTPPYPTIVAQAWRLIQLCWLIVFLLTAQTTLKGQTTFLQRIPLYQFDLPNSKEGNEVQDFLQTYDQRMWFATKSGLISYDGHTFKTYIHSAIDSSSISYNEVDRLLQTRDSMLWVATWGGGLNRFDPKTETFEHFMASENGLDDQHISGDFISDMVEDRDGTLWIATRSGLNHFDPKTRKFTHYLAEADNPKSLASNEVRVLTLDSNGDLWIGTGYPWSTLPIGGLNKYNRTTNDFTQYQPSISNGLKDQQITAIYEDTNDNFWIGTVNNGTYLLDRQSGQFTSMSDKIKFQIEDDNAQIHQFFEFSDSTIWVLSYGSGMILYDWKNDQVRDEIWHESMDKDEFFALNEAWRIFQSHDDTYWICTGDVGQSVFKSDVLLPFLGLVYRGENIQRILAGQEGNIFLARTNNGLNMGNWNDYLRVRTWFDDPKNPKIGTWSFPDDTTPDGIFDNIGSMIETADQQLWFSKLDQTEGIFRFNRQRGTVQRYRNKAGTEHSLSGNELIGLAKTGAAKTVWALDDQGVINRYETESDGFIRYAPSQISGLPTNPTFFGARQDGRLLIGSIDNDQVLKLTTFDPATQRATTITVHTLETPNPAFEITGIQETKTGTLWVGTTLNLLKIREQQISNFPFDLNLIGTGRSIILNRSDQLWLGMSTGIAAFNPEDEQFYAYPIEQKYNALPFGKGSVALVENDILFCGRGGCQMVNEASQAAYTASLERPQSLKPSQIVLTEFLINGKKSTHPEHDLAELEQERYVELNHDQNNFSIELSLKDFNRPRGNYFEYKLDGYDNYWRRTGDKNMVYYAQLPSGNYTLLVRGFSSKGAYGEMQPIQFNVAYPWWASGWAYAIYALAFFGILYSIYRFQLTKNLAEAETQRLQELDAAKSQLYTNITHEFRTPLTVILGMAKQLDGQVSGQQEVMVEMINRNGQNLLNLVNQMLDLSKLDSGQLTLDLQRGDIITYLKYLAESFHSFAESRAVKVHFLSDLEVQEMDFDPHKIQQIVSNLLSNAIKFTPSGGDIYITVQPLELDAQRLLIKVKDTGVGISEDRLEHIFKRFYQADNSYTKEFEGTGIGLALVAELVKLMHGTISARSSIGKGSEFTVELPIERQSMQAIDGSHFAEAKIQFHREGIADDLVERPTALALPQERPTVLVVEDNYDVRRYIRACLTEQYELIMAENGERGVEKAIEHVPDFIISDVMMPLKDGYTLAKELKADYRTSHIPIVLLTAKVDADSRLEGLKQGVDAYLAKPFDPKELVLRIENLLALRKKLQQHYLSRSDASEGAATVEPADEIQEKTVYEDVFVKRVQSYVLENLDNSNLDVQTLCREIGMSQSQLNRKLSALTGLSTNRFIRHVRIGKAKELLVDPNLTITAVAFDTGYNDPSYFGRVFKKEVGLTPAEWQKSELEKSLQ